MANIHSYDLKMRRNTVWIAQPLGALWKHDFLPRTRRGQGQLTKLKIVAGREGYSFIPKPKGSVQWFYHWSLSGSLWNTSLSYIQETQLDLLKHTPYVTSDNPAQTTSRTWHRALLASYTEKHVQIVYIQPPKCKKPRTGVNFFEMGATWWCALSLSLEVIFWHVSDCWVSRNFINMAGHQTLWGLSLIFFHTSYFLSSEPFSQILSMSCDLVNTRLFTSPILGPK
jgi:hypothetical protein